MGFEGQGFIHSNWDTEDDWSAWGFTGATNVVTAWLNPPARNPWRGGAGEIRNSWTPGVDTGTARWFYRNVMNGDALARNFRATWLWKFKRLHVAGIRQGPISTLCWDAAGVPTNEDPAIRFHTSPPTDARGPLVTMMGATEFPVTSKGGFYPLMFAEQWLLFDLWIRSQGTAEPYTVQVITSVYDVSGSHPIPVACLTNTSRSSLNDVFHVRQIRFGYENMDKFTDHFHWETDEIKVQGSNPTLGYQDVIMQRGPCRLLTP